MIIYTPDLTSPISLTTPHDPSEVVDYTIFWGDFTWTAAQVYEVGDRVVPTSNKGIAAVCVNPGVSGALEPTWVTTRGTRITDGTVIWKIDYSRPMLDYAEAITASTWTSDNIAITLASTTHTDKTSTVYVSTVPATLSSFTITNKIVTSSNPTRTYERSIIIPVSQL